MLLLMAEFIYIQISNNLDESFCRRMVIKNVYWEEIR